MSRAANKAKYQYQKAKGYQEQYWERRAEREGIKPIEAKGGQSSLRTKSSEKISERITKLRILKADLTDDLGNLIECCINRSDYEGRDESYIKAIENSNKSMRAENRRLTRLLREYQAIIKIGINEVIHNEVFI